jgi:hypothetical protein
MTYKSRLIPDKMINAVTLGSKNASEQYIERVAEINLSNHYFATKHLQKIVHARDWSENDIKELICALPKEYSAITHHDHTEDDKAWFCSIQLQYKNNKVNILFPWRDFCGLENRIEMHSRYQLNQDDIENICETIGYHRTLQQRP